MKNAILHIFKDTSMSFQHAGLRQLASTQKVKLEALKEGEHAVFLNGRLNKVKLYSYNGVLSYWVHPEGARINLHMIEQIPRCFSEKGGMNWEEAERLALDKVLNAPGKIKPATRAKLIKGKN